MSKMIKIKKLIANEKDNFMKIAEYEKLIDQIKQAVK